MSKEIVGIDFGVQTCCVAVFKNETVDVVANENGNRTTPSVVAYLESGETLVGDEAQAQMARNTTNTIFNMKKIIGKKYADIPQEKIPFTISQTKLNDKGRDVAIEVSQNGKTKEIAPEAITGSLLHKMKEIAEHSAGSKVSRAVISVPAYFTVEQTQALKDAATRAGIEVYRVIPESIAVALWRVSNDESGPKQRKMLVFDHGAALTISVVSVESGLFELRATTHEPTLGGAALDTLLVNYFVTDFTRKNRGKDLASNARAMAKLRTACERAKKTLSTMGQASVEIDGLFEGQDYNGSVSRARFEDMAGSHIKACLAAITSCLEGAKLTKQDITDVVLAGGGARTPTLQTALAAFFEGKEITKGVNPEECVALGAALQGVVLGSNAKKDNQVAVNLPVLPYDIGIELPDGQMGVVLPRGSVVPSKKVVNVSTNEDNQEALFLQIYGGNEPIAKDNTLLGRYAISGIKPATKGHTKLKVKFDFDSSNTLNVTSESTSHKLSVHVS